MPLVTNSLMTHVAQLTAWGKTCVTMGSTAKTDRGLTHLGMSAQSGRIDRFALGTYREFRDIVDGHHKIPARHARAMRTFDTLLKPDVVFEDLRLPPVIGHQSETQPLEGDTGAGPSKTVLVPLTTDPRAIILPVVEHEQIGTFFINGFDPAKKTISQIFLSKGDKCEPCLMIRIQNVANGEVIKVRVFGTQVFTDEKTKTMYFAISHFNDSPIFALSVQEGEQPRLMLARYPSYEAAGLEAPITKSTVLGYKGSGRKNGHYHADIFVSHKEKIEISIIENEVGEVDKVVDFRLGQEFVPLALRHEGKPTFQINDHLKIALTRRLSDSGYYYQVDILHDLGDKKIVVKNGPSLVPVALTPDNVMWLDAVKRHCSSLKEAITQNFNPLNLVRELHKIRKEEGVQLVHEVIMALYYDETTQMSLITALKQSRGLPLPVDSRIIPASADTLTSLCEYLSQQNTTGFLSKNILRAAQKVCSVPAGFIHGLWLALKSPTHAEIKFFERGAATPEYVVGGRPVLAYRRVVDEKYTGIANTLESRQNQRERVYDMLTSDAVSASFKHYLGLQLDIARDFDLLILDSGLLFYNDKRVHPLEYSADKKALTVIDNDGDIFEILRDRPRTGSYTKPLALSEANIEAKSEMLATHPDDTFRYVWLADGKDAYGGSYANGTLLLKDSVTGLYRRPTAFEIVDSMKGMVDLPPDYLSPQHMLPAVGRDIESIKSLSDLTYQKGKPIEIDLSDYGHGFNEVSNKKIKMVPYFVEVEGVRLELYLPSPESQTAKALAKKGYYVAAEKDLHKIVKYYLHVARKGYMPFRPNLYLMPGMMDDILGFYRFDDESMFISSRKASGFEDWAARMFFTTVRHEMGHAIHRINPWISSLLYRCMALDGVTMDYGHTNINEYWAVLVQNFFDHPQNRYRFPNGYKLIYNLIKLREMGIMWDGPKHRVPAGAEGQYKNPSFKERNIDGTHGAVRILATGGDPFAVVVGVVGVVSGVSVSGGVKS
ncbi:MAG: hypothetical protein HQM16_14990 [Deltaproteobacteria bacterium]|nr:hypothetical protein [Deltaproteobacteria bacterium]